MRECVQSPPPIAHKYFFFFRNKELNKMSFTRYGDGRFGDKEKNFIQTNGFEF